MKKTNEEVQKGLISYLTKTSQHLFINEKGDIYKYDTTTIDGVTHFYCLGFDKDLNLKGIYNFGNTTTWQSYYGNNSKCVLSHWFFLSTKQKSIKNFKAFKEKYSKIKNALSELKKIESEKTIFDTIKSI